MQPIFGRNYEMPHEWKFQMEAKTFSVKQITVNFFIESLKFRKVSTVS